MNVTIAQIQVPQRRREELGDLQELADSIAQYGLIHPIVIDAEGWLVAGEQRLRACQLLGWTEIEVREYGALTDEERWVIELEENLRRKDLTPYERSKTMVRLVATARQVARAEPTCSESEQVSTRPPRGPSRTPGSYRDVSQRTGIPVATIKNAEAHVAAVDKYPELASHTQADALTMAKNLDNLPDDERQSAREKLQAHDSVTLTTLAEKPPMPPRDDPDAHVSVKWPEALHKILVVLNSFRDCNRSPLHPGYAAGCKNSPR